ncbi:hypothetical protein [Mucilaginibacter panaciglaebae]|uniref:DUF3185 family protein n=1 Tax=Mucilaginibacter panaciglaebae TaxID=502331 RepID=A0ABP7WNS0_9SPHI
MNTIYGIGGFFLTALGIYITKNQLTKIKTENVDQLGFDYKLLGGGVMAIIIGIVVMVKHF